MRILILCPVLLLLLLTTLSALTSAAKEISRRKVPKIKSNVFRNSRQTPEVPALYSAPKPRQPEVPALYSAPKPRQPEVPALYSAPKSNPSSREEDNHIEYESGTTENSAQTSATETAESDAEGVSEDYQAATTAPVEDTAQNEFPTESPEGYQDSYFMRGKAIEMPGSEYGPPPPPPRALYGPPSSFGQRALDQQQIETTPFQHQIQIHVVPPQYNQPQEQQVKNSQEQNYDRSEERGEAQRMDGYLPPSPYSKQQSLNESQRKQQSQEGGYSFKNSESNARNREVPQQGYSNLGENKRKQGQATIGENNPPPPSPPPREYQTPRRDDEPVQQYQQPQSAPQQQYQPQQSELIHSSGGYEVQGGYENQQPQRHGNYEEQPKGRTDYDFNQNGGYGGEVNQIQNNQQLQFEGRQGGYESEPQKAHEIYSDNQLQSQYNNPPLTQHPKDEQQQNYPSHPQQQQQYDQNFETTNSNGQAQSYLPVVENKESVGQQIPLSNNIQPSSGQYLPPIAEGRTVLNSLEQRMEELEGLNGNIVDAALLQRVQQIIEQHERQQKALINNIQRDNEAAFSIQPQYGSPYPSPQSTSSFGQSSSSPASSQFQPQVNTPEFNLQQIYQDVGNNIQSQTAGQQFPERKEGRSESEVEYQKALLSNHFTETEPINNGAQYLPPTSQQQKTSFGGPTFAPQTFYSQQQQQPFSYAQKQQGPPSSYEQKSADSGYNNINVQVGAGLQVSPNLNVIRDNSVSPSSENVETPRPIYGVPLAPVIGLDSNDNFHVVNDDNNKSGQYENNLVNHQFSPSFQSIDTPGNFYGRNRRRVGIVTKLNTINRTPILF